VATRGGTFTWAPRYTGGVLAYCWRCFRARLLPWIATTLAIGIILAVAANTELVLVLAQRSLAAQARSASQFQVFLAGGANAQQVQTLQNQIAGLNGVRGVHYVSKAQALAQARANPAIAEIGSAADNPYPASIMVNLQNPAASAQVTALALKSPAVDRSLPTSYTPREAHRLSAALNWANGIVIGIGVAALLIASLISMVLIRAEVRSRRAELRILALVGAPRPVIRLPLLFESLSLAVAGTVIAVATLLAVGTRLVAGANAYMPFLQMATPNLTLMEISLATLVGSLVTLGICSLLVRLPR
jgi:cell division protein FtsX